MIILCSLWCGKKSIELRVRNLKPYSSCTTKAVWPWKIHIMAMSLSFSFWSCKIMIIVPALPHVVWGSNERRDVKYFESMRWHMMLEARVDPCLRKIKWTGYSPSLASWKHYYIMKEIGTLSCDLRSKLQPSKYPQTLKSPSPTWEPPTEIIGPALHADLVWLTLFILCLFVCSS